MGTIRFLAIALTLFTAPLLAHASSEDAKQAEMMKAWKEFSTPGTPHAVLASMVGKWKYSSKWWETADSKPQESSGKSKMKMILGGRFLQHHTKGKAMGMPFEGMGMTGYNNLKKEYETLWLDNMSTGMMKGSGSYDESTKTLKDSGEFSCPMTKGTQTYRSEWKMIDHNHTVFTMWGPELGSGKEIKQMEMSFTRTN